MIKSILGKEALTQIKANIRTEVFKPNHKLLINLVNIVNKKSLSLSQNQNSTEYLKKNHMKR